MSDYQTLIKYENGELQTYRDYTGLHFVIKTNSGKTIFLSPNYVTDYENHSIYIDMVNVCGWSIASCDVEDFKVFQEIFNQCQYLVSTFYGVVLDNSPNEPYQKSDIQTLLNLPLLLDEKLKLEHVLNDFTYIYLIKDRETGLFKIGKSGNPQKRLKELVRQATLQPKPNDYILYLFWLDRSSAETILHKQFASKRVRGEWFRLEPADVLQIEKRYLNRSEEISIEVQ